MFKRIDHVEIIPADLEKTIKFYTDILGFKIKDKEEVNVPPLKEVIYLELNDTVVELLSVNDPVLTPGQQWQVGYSRSISCRYN